MGLGISISVGIALMALLIFISHRYYRRRSRLSGKNSTAPQVEVELTELDADNKDATLLMVQTIQFGRQNVPTTSSEAGS